MTLLGAQAGVDARGRSGDESVITEAGLSTPNPDVLVEITSSGDEVTLDGFTLIGDQSNTTADTSVIRAWSDALTVENSIVDGMHGIIWKSGDDLAVQQSVFDVSKLGITAQPGVSSNLVIADSVFSLDTIHAAGGESAVHMTSVTGATISGNVASGFINGNAVGGSNVTDVTISGNTFDGNRKGVNFWGTTTGTEVLNNTISNSNNAGVNIKGQDLLISGNTLDGNAVGVEIGHHVLDTLNVTVTSNTYSNLAGTDAIVIDNAEATITGETITGAATGITVSGGADVTITDVTVSDGGTGILVQDASADLGEAVNPLDITGNDVGLRVVESDGAVGGYNTVATFLDDLSGVTENGVGIDVDNGRLIIPAGSIISGNITGIQGTGNDLVVEIDGATISGNDRGVRTTGGSISVANSTIENNTLQGLIAFEADSVTITNTGFEGNASGQPTGHGYGDLTLYDFTGDATLTDVSFDAEDPDYAIQIRASETGYPAAGTIDLTNLTITGDVQRYGLIVQNYSDFSTASFSGVSIDSAGDAGLVFFEVAGPEIGLGDTTFGGSDNYDIVASLADMDATGVTFTGLMGVTLAEQFAIEHRVIHAIDAVDPVFGAGKVVWNPGNWYVTPNSYIPPFSTAPSIQRAVDAAGAGATITIQDGLYAESNIVVDESVTIQGQSRSGVVVTPSAEDVGNELSSFDGDEQIGFLVTADGVTLRTLTVDGRANNLANGGTLPDHTNYRIGITNYSETEDGFADLTVDDVTVRYARRRGIALWPSGTGGHAISNSLIEYVEGQQAIASAADNVTITGNTIRYAGSGIGLFPSLPAGSGEVLTVADNVITDIAGAYSTYYGHSWPRNAIYYRNPNVDQTVVFTGNQISIGAGDEEAGMPGVLGMYVYNAGPGSVVSSNTIDATGGTNNWGIYLGGCAGTLVQGNTFTLNDSDSGIYLGRGNPDVVDPNTITGNTFTSTGATTIGELPYEGVAIVQSNYGEVFWMVENPQNTDNLISDNTITGFLTGIVMDEDGASFGNVAATVENNTITGNGTGILIKGAAEIAVSGNDLTGNDVGVRASGDAVVDLGGGSLGSVGDNDLSGYTGAAGNYAVENLNLTVAGGGAGVDVLAENNDWGPVATSSVIEQVIHDDTDDASRTEVVYTNPQNLQTQVATVWVDDDWAGTLFGADPDGAGPATAYGTDAFAVVQDGINAVLAGGTVHVLSGLYGESIDIDKALSLLGQTGAVLDGTGFGTIAGVDVHSGDVTIDGMTIRSFGGNGVIVGYEPGGPGNLQNVQITDNTIHGIRPGSSHGFGLYVGYQSEDLPGGPAGDDLADLLDYSGLVITGNTIYDTANAGVVLQSITGSLPLIFADNTVHDSDASGLWIDSAQNIEVTGNSLYANASGVFVSGYGDGYYEGTQDGAYDPRQITLSGNFITDNDTGVNIYDAWPAELLIHDNDLSGNGLAIHRWGGLGGDAVNASANWFGSVDEATVAGLVSGGVDFTPYLAAGDADAATPGFQSDYSTLYVTDAGEQIEAVGRVQEAIDLVTHSTVHVNAGTYTGAVTLDKAVALLGAQHDTDVATRTAGGPAEAVLDFSGTNNGIVVTAGDVEIDGLDITGDAGTNYGIYVAAGANDLSNVLIENNFIHGMAAPNTPFSDRAYGVLADAAGGTITSLTIQGNEIYQIGGVYLGTGDKAGGFGLSLHEIAGVSGTGSGAVVTGNAFREIGSGHMTADPSQDAWLIGTAVALQQNGDVLPSSGGSITGNTYADTPIGVSVHGDATTVVSEPLADFNGVDLYVLNWGYTGVGPTATIDEAALSQYAKAYTNQPLGLAGLADSHGYFHLIQDAVDASQVGGLVELTAGTFAGNVTLDKDVTLDGAGIDQSIVDGIAAGTATLAIAASGVSGDSITIRDLTVQGADDHHGIAAYGRDWLEFIGVAARANDYDGFHISDAENVDMTDVEATDNGVAMHATVGSGVNFNGVRHATLTNLTATDNWRNGLGIGARATTTGDSTDIGIVGGTFSSNAGSADGLVPTSNGINLYVDDAHGTSAITDVAITGSLVASGNTMAGITLFNAGGASTISGISIGQGAGDSVQLADNQAGMLVFGNVTDVDASVDISRAVANPQMVGVLLTGVDAAGLLSPSDVVLDGSTFDGFDHDSPAISLVATDGVTTTVSSEAVSVHGATFDGLSTSSATLTDHFAIEDLVVHTVDVAAAGLVTWNPGHVYVTTDSYAVPLNTDPDIQRGIDAAPAGDTVHVQAGRYDNNLTIDKRITLTGEGSGSSTAGNTVIHSAASSKPVIVIAASGDSAADRLLVQDLRVTGATGSGNPGSGVRVTAGGSYLTFDNVAAVANEAHGLNLDVMGTMTDVVVTNSDLSSNNGSGLNQNSYVTLDGLTLTNNTLSDNDIGAYLEGMIRDLTVTGDTYANSGDVGLYVARLYDGGVISGITADGNVRGLVLYPYSGFSVTDSVFTNNSGEGIAIGTRAVISAPVLFDNLTMDNPGSKWNLLVLGYSGTGLDDLTIQNSTFRNSNAPGLGYGMWLTPRSGAAFHNVSVLNNEVTDNVYGISLNPYSGCVLDGAMVSGNTVTGHSDTGIEFWRGDGTAVGNTVTGNATGVRVTYGSEAVIGQDDGNAGTYSNTITGNDIGLRVDDGSACVEDNDLTGNTVGLQSENGAAVDAGQPAGSGNDFTGLGVSAGGNDFSSYTDPATAGSGAIVQLSADPAVGPQTTPPDMTAFGNQWADGTSSGIENVIYHDAGQSGLAFVEYATLADFAFSLSSNTVSEGQSVTVSGSFTNDPQVHTLTAQWGDGDTDVVTIPQNTFAFNVSHTYADDNPATGTPSDVLTVSVSLEDSSGAVANGSDTVTVSNVAPVLSNVSATSTSENGATTLSGEITDPGTEDTFTLEVTWGDGQSDTYTYGAGTTTFSETHQYLDDSAADEYPIALVLTDDDTGEGLDSTTVTVANVAPALTLDPVSAIVENGVAALSGSFTDPGSLDEHTVTILWGDGASESHTLPVGQRDLNYTHRYLDDNASDEYTISVTVEDDDSGSDTETLAVTVNNVAPTLTLDPVASIDENGVATLTGTISDPGTLDTFTLDIDWGDPASPNNVEQYTYTASGSGTQTFTLTHQYLDDNPSGTAGDIYTISATLTDDDTGSAVDSATVSVNNVAPSPTITGAPPTSPEGAAILLGVDENDIGTLDTFTYAWSLTKDGTAYVTGTPTDQATFTFTPDDDAEYLVSLTVEDDDGQSGSDSATIDVLNVSPTVDLLGNASTDEGSIYSLTVDNLVEPGDDSAFFILVSWGDGGVSTIDLNTQPLPQTLTHEYDDGQPTAPTRTIQATVYDEDEPVLGHLVGSKTVTVNNVAPGTTPGTVIPFNGGAVLEGQDGLAQLFVLAGADPSNADTVAGFRYGFDFNNDGDFADPGEIDPNAAGSTSSSAVVPGSYLADDPSQAVRMRIQDKDGGYNDYTTTITVMNVAPTVDAGGDLSVYVGSAFTQLVQITDPGDEAYWTVDVDYDYDGMTFDVDDTFTTPDRDFDVIHSYAVAGVYTVAVRVADDHASAMDTFEVTVTPDTFRVVDFSTNDSGFDVQFNRTADLSLLNLYSEEPITDADVIVLRNGSEPVNGSIVWDDASNTLSFVKTGGVLAAGSYSVTLRSAADAFVEDGAGALLDGDGDAVPGGDYQTGFTVVNSTRAVYLPDFARGAGQSVDVPATAAGLPIRITDATGVTAVDVDLEFDPALLTITDATKATGLPGGWSLTSNFSQASNGLIELTLSGSTPLSGTDLDLIQMTADVPVDAPYGASQVIRLRELRVNEDAITAKADNALHKAVYLGDASGNMALSGLDSSFVSRVVVNLDTGFAAHSWTDPLIVGDATGDGTLSGQDASYIAQKSVSLSRPEIPDIPTGVTPIERIGRDPLVSIDTGYVGDRGDTVTVAVDIDDAIDLLGANLDVSFDTTMLDVSDSDISLGSLLDANWTLVTNANDASGIIYFALWSSQPHAGGSGNLLEIDFHVRSDSPAGVTDLDVEGELNEGLLELTDSDGDLTVPIGVAITPDAGNTNEEGAAQSYSSTTFGESGAVTYLWTVTKDAAAYSVTNNTSSTFTFTPDDGDATYVVSLEVEDAAGNAGSDTETTLVNNVAPTITADNVSVTVDEAEEATNGGSFGDVGDDTVGLTASIGSVVDNGDGTWGWSYTPADGPASETVTITAQDSDGATSDVSFTLNVNNVAPVVDAGADQTVDEGAIVSVSATFTDAGSADTHTAVVDWGDGQTETIDPASSPIAASHVYADNGAYTVTVTVTDDDGDAGSDSLDVTVGNVAPVVDAGADQAADEGATVSVSASFTDAGSADTHTAVVDWGDGTVEAGVVDQVAGTVTGSHVYADNDVYTVTVTVTDDDGDAGSDSLDVTVGNVAPVVDAGADQTADEGQTVSISASFTDAGSADTHMAQIDWGDGTVEAGVVDQIAGAVTGAHIYADNGAYTVTVTVTDDDGNAGSDTLGVTVHNVAPAPVITDIPAGNTSPEYTTILLGVDENDPSPVDTFTYAWTITRDAAPYMTGSGATIDFTPDKGVYQVTLTVTDDDGGVGTDTQTITVTHVTFRVTSFQPNASGFDVTFNRAADMCGVNLYDGMDASADLPDVTVTGPAGPVAGSLVYDAATNTASWVATGGILPQGSYDIVLVSGAEAWRDVREGELLDGDADGAVGDDYETRFSVTPAAGPVVSLPDFARGPDQSVDVPATDAGLPVTISEGTGVTKIHLELQFSADALNVTAAALADVPGDWTLDTVDLTQPGRVILEASGATALSAGPQEVFSLTGSVPLAAAYGTGHVLRIASLEVNDGTIAAVADRAIHKVAYFGDASGNRGYSALDATLIARNSALLDNGFDAYRLTDPVIIADVTGNGGLSSLDASQVASKSVCLSVPEIPDLPASNTPTIPTDGGDPTLSLPDGAMIAAGGSETLALSVIDTAAGMKAMDLTLRYDTDVLDLADADISLAGLLSGWGLVTNVIYSSGEAIISAWGTVELGDLTGELLNLTYHASLCVGVGSDLTIEGLLNEGGLTMTADNGDITIAGLLGDYNHDGAVTDADYTVWADNYGTSNPDADGNCDGIVSDADYTIWADHYGETLTATAAATENSEAAVLADGSNMETVAAEASKPTETDEETGVARADDGPQTAPRGSARKREALSQIAPRAERATAKLGRVRLADPSPAAVDVFATAGRYVPVRSVWVRPADAAVEDLLAILSVKETLQKRR